MIYVNGERRNKILPVADTEAVDLVVLTAVVFNDEIAEDGYSVIVETKSEVVVT
jgi:hypothetical protein